MPIPTFLENGYLPEGIHFTGLAEIEERFGKHTPRRKELFLRLKYFVELAHHCGALKMLINGSFITAVDEPGDVDVVIRLDQYHEDMLAQGDLKAMELEIVFETRQPKDAFPAYYEDRWGEWVAFFTNVKGSTTLHKGVLEIKP